jgi:hypothetical protein
MRAGDSITTSGGELGLVASAVGAMIPDPANIAAMPTFIKGQEKIIITVSNADYFVIVFSAD